MNDDPVTGTRIWSAARVVGDVRDYAPGHVAVRAGRIVGVGDGFGGDPQATFAHGVIAPGFIDLQVNGFAGVDFLATDAAGLSHAARSLALTGTTAFLPTLITSPLPRVRAALNVIRAARAAPDRLGARVLGGHLEGPVLNPRRHGAHDATLFRTASDPAVGDLIAAAGDALAMVTLAPEIEGARTLMRSLRETGVTIALGHSDARYDEAREAIADGVRMITHAFNAMRPFHHREPGPVVAAALDERCACGLIADGVHLHPAVVALCFRWFGADRVCLVTDATAAAGMPPGAFDLGGQRVRVEAGDAPRLADGTLAGSALRMDGAVANAAAWGVGLRDAVIAASRTPAALAGQADCGRLSPGARADICVLDGDLRCCCTIIEGRVVWRAP